MFWYNYGIQYTPQQTVFVDESSFDRRTAIRGHAWALHGQRAVRALSVLASCGITWLF